MPDLDKWATRQIAAAVSRGVHPLDAQKAAREFLALLPAGADPDTYIVPAYQLQQDVSSPQVADDLRAAWYERTEPRYARLLDARGEG